MQHAKPSAPRLILARFVLLCQKASTIDKLTAPSNPCPLELQAVLHCTQMQKLHPKCKNLLFNMMQCCLQRHSPDGFDNDCTRAAMRVTLFVVLQRKHYKIARQPAYATPLQMRKVATACKALSSLKLDPAPLFKADLSTVLLLMSLLLPCCSNVPLSELLAPPGPQMTVTL